MPVWPYGDHVPVLHEPVFVAPTAYVVGRVEIGAGSGIWFSSVVRGDTGTVRLGEAVNLQEGSVIHTEGETETRLGDRVTLGHGAIVHAARVDDEVLVGIRASVLTGAVIGSGSIIAPHAAVLAGTEIPPESLVVGVPGKVVRTVTSEERDRICRTAAVYRDLAAAYGNHLS